MAAGSLRSFGEKQLCPVREGHSLTYGSGTAGQVRRRQRVDTVRPPSSSALDAVENMAPLPSRPSGGLLAWACPLRLHPRGSLGLGPLPCLLAACVLSLETQDGKEAPAHPGLSGTFLTELIDGLPLL